MAMTEREQRVCAAIAAREDELVELAGELIAFDTTAREVGDPPRDEAACQRHLADRLAAAGAEIDLFEPDAGEMAGAPLVPPGLDFAGRPQLIATLPGRGSGAGHPSLLFNGHIDVVSAEPRSEWTSDPFVPAVRDGRLYGRGACDMKGGVAAMTFAAEVLASLGVRLAGDLVVATNTDEESSGAGGSALVRRGLRADAGIVTEPTDFRVWVACRGSEYGVVTVPGRPGHAEVRHPDWRHGGAVNAIEKAGVVLEAIAALRDRWAADPRWRHPHLSVPSLLPTVVRGGEWAVTYPSSCELTIAVMYVPAQADAGGWGSAVRAEVEQWVVGECARRDDWLAAHPPVFAWWPNGVMPMEIPPATPIVDCLLHAGADLGHPPRLGGLDSWYDGATFTHLAGIPSVGFGPPGFDPNGATVAHTIDEYVPIDGLVSCAQALAVAAMRFCGVA
ncbi:MAG TPA: M20/M25/M40 family metallo-hydrolase [Solirubrobacteraceae bacterium]|nr:M20/M25/M40 family metallo-hydrolase [Solirubrobacteraceae bacterium]